MATIAKAASIITFDEDKTANLVSYKIPVDFEVPDNWEVVFSGFAPTMPDVSMEDVQALTDSVGMVTDLGMER